MLSHHVIPIFSIRYLIFSVKHGSAFYASDSMLTPYNNIFPSPLLLSFFRPPCRSARLGNRTFEQNQEAEAEDDLIVLSKAEIGLVPVFGSTRQVGQPLTTAIGCSRPLQSSSLPKNGGAPQSSFGAPVSQI